MRSEQTRIYLSLVALQMVTMVLMLIITAFAFSDSRQRQTIQGQSTLALTAIELGARSELTTEEILHALSGRDYRLETAHEDAVTQEMAAQALEGRVVYDEAAGFTVFALGEELCVVRQAHTGWAARAIVLYLLLTGAAYLLIALLLGRLAARWLGRPVTAVGEAAGRLARGDFSVRVPMPKHTSEQMRRLTRDFNAMAESLSSVEYLQRDFTSSVSHEIKTPVAAIHACAQLMKLPGLSEEERQEYASAILRESRRLSRLSDSLLRLTRLENQSAPPHRTRYRIGEQLREICASLLPAMEEKRIALETDVPDALAVADEDLMAQVFYNLLDNAVKFAPEGGSIRVRMQRTPQQLAVTVSDTGCGMDEQTVRHIFEKFYQADSSHATQGVGLGLALVRRIVQLHGGRIQVDSEPGRGSVFEIVLPQKP